MAHTPRPDHHANHNRGVAETATNGNEIRVIGLSRSGTHAVVHWMLEQIPGSYCFLNCCQGKQDPYESAMPMDDGRHHLSNLRGFKLPRDRHRPKDWLVFSHEDSFLGNACSEAYERSHDTWVGVSEKRVDLLVLRDPFNLFASRLIRDVAWISPATAVRIWKQHARQFVHGPASLRHAPLLFSYNAWCFSPFYRHEIARTLGLRFDPSAGRCVPACAGGSSFDGLDFNGDARRMNLTGRWRACLDRDDYLALFDDELLELARAIFPELRDVARAIERQLGIRAAKRSA